MRNADRTLTVSESAMVATRTAQMRKAMEQGTTLTLHYTKRDGSVSESTGTVLEVKPNGSKGIVILDTVATKGRPTSVNLYNITKSIAH